MDVDDWTLIHGSGSRQKSLENQTELTFHILLHSYLPYSWNLLDMLEIGKLVILHPVSNFLQGHFGHRHLQALLFFIDEKTET